ncbi:hypothetical protein EG68_12119 [Paragonimus skrjabini miyazakii]|uniref:SCP domain-containing protein n=1 Tax=Paragonimus skrjabini miyazakii TaxID=59628 RepID=A0A8S9YHK7_9TREM|nr:hypothetical protein EG68_12119 [Paragonimus skrjabini miyazakii]
MRTVCAIVVLQTLHLIGFSEGQSQTENGVINRKIFNTRMLKIHNYFRRAVTKGVVKPCAKPMPDLTWNPVLASASQKWAEGCVYDHDDNRGDNVGENLSYSFDRKAK